MALYLYGSTALDVIRYLRAVNGGKIPGRPSRPRKLSHAIHSHRQLNALSDSANRILSHARPPLHAMVPDRNLITKTDRLITHLWSHDIAANAFINLENGVYVPTPAFLLQQLALQLDEVELIRIGLELCGFYSKWSFADKPLHNTVDDEFRGCTFELTPATTSGRIARHITSRVQERGHAKALRALRYVLDNSASPMESATYLLLCLPKRLGGHGLPTPVLNAKVRVSTSTSTTTRYPDLYWQTRSLDVEYDSDQDHSGLWSRYKDSKRMVELAAEKITVLPLTRAQLMDSSEFLAFATSVRRNLGIRARGRTPEWHAKYLDLRHTLLSSED